MLVSGLHMASLALNDTELKVSDEIKVPSKQERDEKIQQIRIGFLNRLHLNRPWAYGLTFCEVMNFTNVLMQIYLTDWFLGGAFLGLGQSVVEPVLKNETNPLDIVFPKVRILFVSPPSYFASGTRAFKSLRWDVHCSKKCKSRNAETGKIFRKVIMPKFEYPVSRNTIFPKYTIVPRRNCYYSENNTAVTSSLS